MGISSSSPARGRNGANVDRAWTAGLVPEGGFPELAPRTEQIGEMVIERDVTVETADGAKLAVDVYRPADMTDIPAVINWSPYGKHMSGKALKDLIRFEHDDLKETAGFEGLQAAWWCPRGYALIAVDPRGSWRSPGDVTTITPDEAEDACDLIEWAGTQSWSSGRVGMAGVSYPAMIQWLVAAKQPSRLQAINPWEGISDLYRETFFHGGIPETHFVPLWWPLMAVSRGQVEDSIEMARRSPLFDAYWAEKVADFERIVVPAYVGASWTDQGIHTRGTLEAFKTMSSEHKYIEIHGRKKFEYFYQPEVRDRLLQFFDHFLKGIDNEVSDWPTVRMEIRERKYVGNWRDENEWPLARTDYRPLYLDAAAGALVRSEVASASTVSYGAEGDEGVIFDIVFDEEVELTGHMKLRLWVEADGSDDMDLFVAVQKLDADGQFVPFLYLNVREDGSVALGWLRVSHRDEDVSRSTEYQPYHTHTREQLLSPGEIVPVDVEILPSSTRFLAGETLRVLVKGKDVHQYPIDEIAVGHYDLRNRGSHVIHTGGDYDSHLLIPVVS